MELKPGYKNSDAGVIPDDWVACRLQDVVDRNNPIAYGVLKPGNYVHNGIPLLQIRDVIHGAIDVDQLHRISQQLDHQYARTKLAGEEVVVSLVGTIGRVAHIPAALAGGNLHRNLGRIYVSEGYDSKFIYYLLNSDRAQAAIKLTTFGSTQALLNLADLRSLPVVVPHLQEQHVIATALSDVDALLGGLDRLIAKKRDIKQAVMQQLLTGHTRLPGFHGSWGVTQFRSLFKQIMPKSSFSSGDGSESGSIPLFVSGGEPKRIDMAQYHGMEALIFSDGGVFAARYFSGDFSVTDHCYTVVLRPEAADMRWFATWFCLHKQQMDRLTFKGSGLRNLDKSALGNIEIHLPGLPEQTAIANVLSDMDAELAVLEQRREKTRAVKLAMMQELLTGKTRLVSREVSYA